MSFSLLCTCIKNALHISLSRMYISVRKQVPNFIIKVQIKDSNPHVRRSK